MYLATLGVRLWPAAVGLGVPYVGYHTSGGG